MEARKAPSPLLVRVLLGAVGLGLLKWAYVILDNIWTYNDSGTLTYILFASVPAVPGVLLLYLALRGGRPHHGVIGRSANGGAPRETGK